MTGDLPPAARVAPGPRQDVSLLAWLLSQASGRVTGTRGVNLFLVLGRHRRLFRGWLHFAGRLMPGGRLPRRESEMVIVRVAHLRQCGYELAHHRRLARRAGLTEADVARVLEGPEAAGWDDRQRTILTAADELHSSQDLSDATWEALRRHLDEETAMELVMLVAHYEMLATTIQALRIPLDRPRGG